MSTTSRILVAFLLILAAGLALLIYGISDRVQRQYLEAAEEPMVDAANLFAALLEQFAAPASTFDLQTIEAAMAAAKKREFVAQIYNVTKTRVSLDLYITDGRGMILYDSSGIAARGENYRNRRDVALSLAGEYGARATRSDPRRSMTATLFVAAPIYVNGSIAGVVSVAKPQRALLAFIDETRAQIRWLGIVLFVVILLGAYSITTIFSRPVRRVAAFARAVARGERPVAPSGAAAPEIAALSRAIEEMRDALEDRDYVERYVQTLTHEIKSPLAAIRGAVELLQEEGLPEDRRKRFLENVHAETARIQLQVDRLLSLSELESRKALHRVQRVDLALLGARVAAAYEGAAEARSVRIIFQLADAPHVEGDSVLLELAVANLLQNAIDFSPPGGVITLSAKLAADGFGEIAIDDEGPGIPEYALPRLFERFYSLQNPATGRKSTGLGLCFVREAAELHRGSASVGNRVDRCGVRAMIRLPLELRST